MTIHERDKKKAKRRWERKRQNQWHSEAEQEQAVRPHEKKASESSRPVRSRNVPAEPFQTRRETGALVAAPWC